jgi:anaerobic ribonucleoside-triphosphate reductase activating protein
MESNRLNVANCISDSIVDGPGLRYVIFTQGCKHHCLGCHNQQTWDTNKQTYLDIDYLVNEAISNKILDGVTISGGEPFLQPEGILNLVAKLKKHNVNVMVYTGYTYNELVELKNPSINKILDQIDYLIDGRFILKERSLNLLYRGSTNQNFIDVKSTRKSNKVVLVDENSLF